MVYSQLRAVYIKPLYTTPHRGSLLQICDHELHSIEVVLYAEVGLMFGMTMMVRVRVGMDLQGKAGNPKIHVERERTESSGKVMTEIGRKKENNDGLTSARSEMKCVALVVPLLGVSVFCRQSVGSPWMIENETGDFSSVVQICIAGSLVNLILLRMCFILEFNTTL